MIENQSNGFSDDPDGEREAAFSSLSPRQREIVEGLGEGLPLKALAEQFGLKRKTAETYVLRACDRLGVHGIWGLTILAVERRIQRNLMREVIGREQLPS